MTVEIMPPLLLGLTRVRVEAMPAEYVETRLGHWNCDPPDGQGPLIRINERQPPAMQAHTLLHEILHVGAWQVGMDNDEHGLLRHEQWVDLSSYTFAMAMRNNPHLVAWLSEQLGEA